MCSLSKRKNHNADQGNASKHTVGTATLEAGNGCKGFVGAVCT